MGFLQRFFAKAAASASQPVGGLRLAGKPTSSNGASSFHLRWVVPPVPIVQVEVTLTIANPPTGLDLFFWALQASFAEGPRTYGAGHLGLQHHSGYPNGGAANWGGYHTAESPDGSGELGGSESQLPGAIGNVNTRNYPWTPMTPYRLKISRGAGGWAGSVTDLATGELVTVRELHCRGSTLHTPMVWSEVFAPCDAESVTVVWSHPVVVTGAGERIPVTSATISYQTEADGGCSNTNVVPLESGIAQITNAQRATPRGATVPFG